MDRRANRIFRRSPPPAHIALFVLGGLSAVVYWGNFRIGRMVSPELLGPGAHTSFHAFLSEFLLLHLFYLLSVYLIIKRVAAAGGERSRVIMILSFAVFFRLCLVPTNPALSSDIYRYIWDGRVQMQGINPYHYPPSAEELAPLRDDAIYPYINRQDFRTIYPAGAQIFFLAARVIAGNSLNGLKGILVFFDVLTLIVLVGLLRVHGLEESRVLIYSWNPLVIYEIAHSGHLEGFTVFLVLLAFYLHAREWRKSGVLVLAFAAAVKLYPALLLPVLLNRGERGKGMLLFLFGLIFIYLPYVSAARNLPGFLPTYFTSSYESFNLGLKFFLMNTFSGWDDHSLTMTFGGALLMASLFFLFKKKEKEQVLRYAYYMTGLQIILMPVALHAWYILPLIPFLAFYPAPAWLLFSGLAALSYLKYATPGGVMPAWVLLLEYLPLFALLVADYCLNHWASQKWFPWRSAGPWVLKDRNKGRGLKRLSRRAQGQDSSGSIIEE
jgi:hypothetical protein